MNSWPTFDLLNHVPTRYVDYSNLKSIKDVNPDEIVTIKGKIVSLKNIYTKRGLKMQIGSLQDNLEKIQIVWFNQPFLVKALYPSREVALSGKVSLFSGRPALVSPEYEILTNLHGTVHTGKLVPVYPETSGITSKWIRTQIRKKFETEIGKIKEFLPKKILQASHLAGVKAAYRFVHFPKNLEEAEIGRKRLAFNELLNLHLKSEYRKTNWRKNKTTNKLEIDQSIVQDFIQSLPFELTNSQQTSVNEILEDLQKDYPMNRLLEGDVGSGKTIVAAIAAFVAFIFPKLKISLITANSIKPKAYSNIFVGTHALIHKKVEFNKVALVVIDEQHRFGVEQRAHLVKKSGTPHVLTMTATPIPRTIALTTHGDLDLSVLTEMPKGRQKVTTWVVPEQKRGGAYKWLRSLITDHHSQAFWVCPLIEQSEKESMRDIKNVTTEYQMLKGQMLNLKLGLLHGRLKAKEKQEVLENFRRGHVDILVTTPVVEVGIDIPNTTIMVIEAAERFGLAQLHQLRGRVGRGKKKSYCLLFGKPTRRLTAMTKMHSGFELAELDLKLRG
ncbi:MAG: ATP-dependent DNA helicase RecG [Candidatus Woesebacteria bacterium GW2011_GWB1_41_10]|uniref:ATP-dependent DNA helicase RecG n=1 Tax=Candidatus Woesebacteria bacterium GW2011_GWB1_41_10 TaxID=1618577 RepID=A0A0G0UCT3_9BACT|nr:MAG: ATP-dependent DNA helicase RecG [Candidatus Woesebacteria bacterium GW2011_GWB1_41_10]